MRSGLASGTTPTTLRVSFQVFDNIVKIFHNFSLNIFLEPLIRNEKSLSTESSWDGFGRQQVDIIIHQEQWQPTGGGITTRVNTTSINVSPVITSGYYDGGDTGHIEDTTHDKIETADRAVKVCKN